MAQLVNRLGKNIFITRLDSQPFVCDQPVLNAANDLISEYKLGTSVTKALQSANYASEIGYFYKQLHDAVQGASLSGSGDVIGQRKVVYMVAAAPITENEVKVYLTRVLNPGSTSLQAMQTQFGTGPP